MKIKLPPRPKNVGKTRHLLTISGKRQEFCIVDEIWRRQRSSTNPKLIFLQKLRFVRDGRTEYRFTYYMLGKKPKMRGRWVFGQYALLIPATDLRALLRAAKRRGWKIL